MGANDLIRPMDGYGLPEWIRITVGDACPEPRRP
jgi:hypothetical protein